MELPSFSYSISRNYPYKWFSWFVVVGGICATVFFSILNLAADGYELNVEYTSDYNTTVAAKRWTGRFPFSFVDKSVASCQPQLIPVNSQFLTNNSALQYTLTGVGNVNGTLPALEYTNNLLENCSIVFIEIDLESTHRTAAQKGLGKWGPNASAHISCLINNNKVPTSMNLTVSYAFLTSTPDTGTAFTFVQPPGNKTDASLWWGQSLLSYNWLDLASQSQQHGIARGEVITQGTIVIRPSKNDDMTDLNFFSKINYHFVTSVNGKTRCCMSPVDYKYSITIVNLAAHKATPDIWIKTDNLAKTFYATIMVDLGQNSSMNMLTNGTALEYFTSTSGTSLAAKTLRSFSPG